MMKYINYIVNNILNDVHNILIEGSKNRKEFKRIKWKRYI